MRIALLASPDSWYARDLARAAAGQHEVTTVGFHNLASSVQTGQLQVASGEVPLDAFDCVLVRTMPPGSLEQVVFRMDALGRLEAAGTTVINPARAIEAAVDKYLATAKLEAAGLAVPKTIVCQSVDQAMEAFAALGEDVVVKPLFGSEGRGIARLCDDALALRAFKMLSGLGAVIYVQEFIEHRNCDYRLLVIGERVLGMNRCNDNDWRTNISRGARAGPLEVTAELAELAHRAAACVGATLAGVDLLPARDGTLYAIEVNAVPGWKALSRVVEQDVAAMVLDFASGVIHRPIPA
ncbi:MAG: RimK family alpha-L-glutamate ligase [Pirellulales bacterium]